MVDKGLVTDGVVLKRLYDGGVVGEGLGESSVVNEAFVGAGDAVYKG